jgi:type II secretory pathway predicted ATPase ExeA
LYTDFYNLKEKPFNLTPSPRYLYLGDVHKEALALLTYGVVERKGFILLTGEVGTGKTTMVQALLSSLEQSVHYVYLSNPVLSQNEFMDYLAFSAFKKKIHFRSKADFLVEFEAFLKGCLQHQENFILLIDEAHKLSFELLEEVRLLSNMETADEKLINIFLVGQPELNEKLSEPQCRALLQRISVRYHIKPLNLQETREYVRNRLRIAGAGNGQRIFPGSTVKSVHQYSEGYPRMINILCDNALLLGYSREKHTITPIMIKECHEDLKLDAGAPKEQRAEPKKKVKGERGRSEWMDFAKWILLLVLAFFVGMFLTGKGVDVYHSLFSGAPGSNVITTSKQVPGQAERMVAPEKEKSPQESPAGVDEQEGRQRAPGVGSVSGEGEAETVPPVKEVGVPGKETTSTRVAGEVPPVKAVIVKEGDTITGLASEIYGFVNDRLVERIRKSNPDIADINRISVGQKIVFPPLKGANEAPIYTVYLASFTPIERARNLFQKLSDKGYEAYILPFHDPEKGNLYRVTVGNFNDRATAEAYASKILKEGTSDYAKPIQVELK